ncbi:hypothetical protein LCGC14_0892080 [marine sediment metagenome]|uniref:Uncharacterized protein n=1 Tax=marine sediment metagenome TaxID=412755 RepID=A0A0F9NYW4_9ZZZZ
MSETKHTFLPWSSVITSAYRDGFKEGIRLFAWWKDGVQQVGTTGTTFKEAVAKDIPTEVDCDAYLTEAAKQEISARPKVEELLKSIRESDRIYDHVCAAAREVEAVLKI